MAKSVDRICAKYEFKLRAGRLMARLDGDRAAQVAAFRRYAVQAEEKRLAISQLLGGEGIYSIWWPFYLNFGRSLARLTSRMGTTEALRLAALAELENWVARSLERSVLEKIAREVFDLDLTGSTEPLARPPEPT